MRHASGCSRMDNGCSCWMRVPIAKVHQNNVRRRRRRDDDDGEAKRAARALSLVRVGELSAARQALEGAAFALGTLATLAALTDPEKRASVLHTCCSPSQTLTQRPPSSPLMASAHMTTSPGMQYWRACCAWRTATSLVPFVRCSMEVLQLIYGRHKSLVEAQARLRGNEIMFAFLDDLYAACGP